MTSYLDILRVLDANPELRQINARHPRNERFFAALAAEPLFPRHYDRSQQHLERANAVIPLAAQTFSKSRLQYPQPSPLFVSHGRGGCVFDVDGNEFVDLVSALLPNILGYGDPDVDYAIRTQLDAGISFSLATELEAHLAETLCRLIPCAQSVRFGKTGTDATTAAVRLARAYTGRDHVLICGGYHGWADWSVERNRGVPDVVQVLTTRVPFGDPAAIINATVNQWATYAAVIVEPESDLDYLKWLREFCNETNAVLIFDEVITGFRWHLGGAQAYFGVTPDLACFGKAMANGMPLSAVVGRKDIMRLMEPPDNIFYSGTFFGETLSLAASIATIAKLEREKVLDHIHAAAWHTTEMVNRRLSDFELRVISISDSHALPRLSFRPAANATADQIRALFIREMTAAGVLIIASNNLTFAHGAPEFARINKAYAHALGTIRDALDHGDIAKRLGNTPVPTGANVRSA